MNKLGKTLILFIMLMSTVFLALAVMVGASHRNWKLKASTLKADAERNEKLVQDAKSKSDEKEKLLDAERVARSLQLSQLESQLTVARRNREEKEKQLAEVLIESQQRQDNLKQAEDRLSEHDTELKKLKKQNTGLIDDIAAQRNSVMALTNQLYKIQGESDDKEILAQDLAAALAKTQKVLKANGLTENDLTAHIAPKLDGVVIQVDGDIMVIGIGTDDGLRKGHVVDVYRRDRFIGKAVVTKAEPNMSAAKVIPEFKQQSVMRGDHVTTKL